MKLMNFLKKNQTIIIALVVICVVGYYLLVVKESFEAEKPSPSNPSKKLIFFHMNGCPHCVTFKPEWEKIAEECKKMKDLDCKDFEVSDEGASELHKLHEVRGFPTIILVDGPGKGREHKGPRTKEAILAMVDEE